MTQSDRKGAGLEKPVQERDDWFNLTDYFSDPEVLKLIPKAVATKYNLFPLYVKGEVLHVAMVQPKDLKAIDEVRRITKLRAIVPHSSKKEDVLAAIDRNYAMQDSVSDIITEIQKERIEAGEGTISEKKSLEEMAEQAPVIKLVNHIILQAIQDRCSDIHFEPDEKMLRVRCRLDGILQENYVFQKAMESAILARIKITAGMDIAEKRKPQDGRIKILLESKKIDVRVSSLPTLYGENIVLRLLDKTSVSNKLSDLGMEGHVLDGFSKLVRNPYGIILVTGPTGSGKSTTLYAALSTINSIDKNIVTVEDPIEYDMELLRQTQVNPKIGLTFASGLRSILRQDPDVIMVGEIRDTETADIAVQAALTGHLVLSTLHTNDACGAITRLIDMEIPPFLIASSVIGVLAQRLVRRICDSCKEKIQLPENFLKELGQDPKTPFYQGTGCDKCKKLKYAGRTAIHEFFAMTDQMRELITKRASQGELTAAAREQGMKSLHESAIEKAKLGITSLEEALKVTGEM